MHVSDVFSEFGVTLQILNSISIAFNTPHALTAAFTANSVTSLRDTGFWKDICRASKQKYARRDSVLSYKTSK